MSFAGIAIDYKQGVSVSIANKFPRTNLNIVAGDAH
jgi:hypothetical protein